MSFHDDVSECSIGGLFQERKERFYAGRERGFKAVEAVPVRPFFTVKIFSDRS